MSIVVATGTSTGIGQATAITLARAGHTVFAGMRNLDRGGELREIASKENLPVTIVQLDVDSDSSVDDAFNHILHEKGQIDVLVNNAGIGARGPIELMPVAVFRQVMETNFFGGLRCIKTVMSSMRERRSGCIINVTSVAGQFGMSPQGAYAASKWAFEGLSECLAQELSPFNVRVAIVEPGVIATPLTTTPRPVPPPNAYSMHGRRLGAYFVASLSNPTSPFEVAKRPYHHIPVFKPADDGIEPWLNLGNAAKLLKIAPKTLRLAAEAGEIEAFHPLSDGPWIFARASLMTTAAQSIAERARQNPRYPAGSHPNQQSLFSSTT
ncbi:SDR family NAD(P)-dependent oxidoreductase [Bradyrhizobium sp. Ash2021]|uniref:SDR family NAD(P)-dependent oxidoreductase n=1 Tax=Bradyrhizobium sp. Ash2021 TaxID=2954771 RepID=UPI002814D517|nr:SDR family NAD(P)-dependent oxidoreductase [Bradyrhizobium sp. Ash2021]WMT79621.1 SDR family NAD(P)-dependent oxidoreductase [Bradyrhizobium sp. Ash2021]